MADQVTISERQYVLSAIMLTTVRRRLKRFVSDIHTTSFDETKSMTVCWRYGRKTIHTQVIIKLPKIFPEKNQHCTLVFYQFMFKRPWNNAISQFIEIILIQKIKPDLCIAKHITIHFCLPRWLTELLLPVWILTIHAVLMTHVNDLSCYGNDEGILRSYRFVAILVGPLPSATLTPHYAY